MLNSSKNSNDFLNIDIVFSKEDFLQFGSILLEKFLLKKTNISFLQIKKLIRIKKIKINNKTYKDNHHLIENDVITVLHYKNNPDNNLKYNTDEVKKFNFSKSLVKKAKENIIYEDNDLIFYNKERGICVQGGTDIANSLEDILSFIYNQKIRIVHRIDKETTGIVVFAKNYISAVKITKLFQENKIIKTYLAIADGLPKKNKDIINNAIFYKDSNLLKDAITEYEVLDRKQNFSLLKILPKTGRKHQIRIHLSNIDCPILGDIKYNKKNTKSTKIMHLYALSIKIPNYQEISIDSKEIYNAFYNV